MAVKQARLKASERKIADVVTEEVYKRLSRRLATKLDKSATVVAARAPILARAAEVFGSAEVGVRWLQEPNPALKMKTPVEVITSARGRKQVEAILGRIEHGVIS